MNHSKSNTLPALFQIIAIGLLLCLGNTESASAFNHLPETEKDSFQQVTTLATDTLHKAVVAGNQELVSQLLEEGIDINGKDSKGWTALDYAKKGNKQDIKQLLIDKGAITFHKPLPDMLEGPHLRAINNTTFEVAWLKHKAGAENSEYESKTILIDKLPMEINGVSISASDIPGQSILTKPTAHFKGVEKLFVVGDIHGQYDRAFSLLRNNKIIDDNGNWIWGKGHLVFLGDIFDRGTKVTEALWLIFELEKQAKKAGGMVHLVLANHEFMIFKDDLRYITNDYYSICENLGLSYTWLYDEQSVLGQWLRQKPVIIKINDYLFMHAGISPALFKEQASIDQINGVVWEFLNDSEDMRNEPLRKLLLGSEGIVWYRGLVNDGKRNGAIEESTLDGILAFYDAKTIVFGHSEVDSVSPFYGGKVIDVNIPKWNSKIEEQGLLIHGKKLWVLYDSSKRKRLLKD